MNQRDAAPLAALRGIRQALRAIGTNLPSVGTRYTEAIDTAIRQPLAGALSTANRTLWLMDPDDAEWPD